MTPTISIRPQDLAIVQTIVGAGLPADAQVWVFGSRAKGTTRRGADLDLAIDAGRRLKQAERIALNEAFEESDLPYTVDVVDMHEVSEQFRAIIDEHKIALPR